MQIRLVRHATLLVEVDARRLLIDPMLDPAGARDPITRTPSPRRNPLVPLPMAAEDVVRDVDAVLVTHLHVDHLDDTAVELLRERDLPVLCQPQDAAVLRGRGLSDVRPVDDVAELPGELRIHRTEGRHGSGELAERLAPVSGFVIRATGEPTLYVAGDTVWCELVEQAIDRHRPDIVVVNAGGARFLQGDPITMTPADVLAAADAAGPAADVIAVHMDAINHCLVTRADLGPAVGGRVSIPADGEVAWSSPAAP